MSTANLPDPQTAYNHLFSQVHQRVFFSKCAAAGYEPRSPQEAEWMLSTAAKLAQLEEQTAVKAATDDSPYRQASEALDHVLQQHGMATGSAPPVYVEEQNAIKQAAFELAHDPAIYDAVLSLKAAEAAEIQQQLAAAGVGR